MAREKKTGILTSISNTTTGTFSTVENSVGIIADSLIVGREYLKPTHMEAKVETLATFAEGLKELIALGIDEAEAKAYLSVAL
ncbi:MAG: hypothetical protein KAH01_04830 [Caldisericia bacterium]|nr:hypothetical protein [Caldisericia bacterium]